MKNIFPDIETTKRIELGSMLENFTQRHNRREQVRRFDMNQHDCENKKCASTQFLQIQKNQLIDLQEHLQQYCSVLPVFGFNSAKCDFIFFKSYLLTILVNERDIKPTLIKKRTSLSCSI